MVSNSRMSFSTCTAVCLVTLNNFYRLASAEDLFADSENIDLRFRREAVDSSVNLQSSDLISSSTSANSPARSAFAVVAVLVALCAACLLVVAWRYHPASLTSLRSLISASIRRRRGANHGLAFGPPVHRQAFHSAVEPSWAERLFMSQKEPTSVAPALSFVDMQIDSLQPSVNSLHSVDAVTLDDRYRPLPLK